MKYGPNTETVEAFIEHLKGMTAARNSAALDAAWDAAWDEARDAAMDAAWDAAVWNSAWDAARYAASDAARYAAYLKGLSARYAVYEIIGASLMRERGQPFYFLPMFGFDSPEAVLVRSAAN